MEKLAFGRIYFWIDEKEAVRTKPGPEDWPIMVSS